MKTILVLFVLLGAMCSLAMAGACGTGTMADYTASGFSCTIDSLLFSNFGYVGTALGTATAIDPASLKVVPQTVGPEFGFLFSAAWSVGPGDGLDSLITYTVTGEGVSITDALLGWDGFVSISDGVASVGETLFGTAVPISLFVSASGAGTIPSDSATFFGVNSLDIFKDVAVNGNSTGTAVISDVTNLYSTTTVPEPNSVGLVGGSVLLAICVALRRRQRWWSQQR